MPPVELAEVVGAPPVLLDAIVPVVEFVVVLWFPVPVVVPVVVPEPLVPLQARKLALETVPRIAATISDCFFM
jgi:hypothetical protein